MRYEMYKLSMVVSSIFRHKRRNVISFLLLVVTLSVAFCSFFYINFSEVQKEAIADRYGNRCHISFRNELQYSPEYPWWSALDIRWNGTSTTNGVPDIFFDPEAMAMYDHPYPATKEMFDAIGALEECKDYALVYADTAYGFSEDIPQEIQQYLDALYGLQDDHNVPTKIATEHIVLGGDLTAFSVIARENVRSLYNFFLKEGKEPGKGECVITDFYAKVYQKGVGDILTLCDVYGEPVAELTISGIYQVCATDRYEFVNPKVPRSGRWVSGADFIGDFQGVPDVGTPFDRLCEDVDAWTYMLNTYRSEYYRVSYALLGLVHTDFETAYTLYGTEETDASFETRHHINNFFAYYDLYDGALQTSFEEKVHQILPQDYSDEFTVYMFHNSYNAFIQNPEVLYDTGMDLLRISIFLTILIFCIVTIVLVHENGREIGVYLSLGISEKDVYLRTAGENTLLMILSLAASMICGRFIHQFLSIGYTYIKIYELSYSTTGMGLVFAIGAVVVSFILTILFTALYIRVHSPIQLIRQDE